MQQLSLLGGQLGYFGEPPRPALAPPDAARLKTARRAAGAGEPMAEIVSDERG